MSGRQVSMLDQTQELHLDVLGRRNWLERADKGELKRPAETIERKRVACERITAAWKTLELFAKHESAIRDLLREKQGRGE